MWFLNICEIFQRPPPIRPFFWDFFFFTPPSKIISKGLKNGGVNPITLVVSKS